MVCAILLGLLLSLSPGTNNNGELVSNVPSVSFCNAPFSQIGSATKIDDFLYMSTSSNLDEFNEQLVEFNVKTKESQIIYTSQYSDPCIMDIRANNQWLVWNDADTSYSHINIYYMDRVTKKTKHIYSKYDQFENMDTPELYDHYVSWIGYDEQNNFCVFLYDILDEKLDKIYTIIGSGMYATYVHMNDNQLVWSDHFNDKGYYFVMNLDDRKIRKIESPYAFPGFCKIIDDKIFALHWDRMNPWTWRDQHFGYYDLKNNRYFPLKYENLSDSFVEGDYMNSFYVKEDYMILEIGSSVNVIKITDNKTKNIYHGKYFADLQIIKNGQILVQKDDLNRGTHFLIWHLE
jgi:hypothetical protein